VRESRGLGRTDDATKAELVVVPVLVDYIARGLCHGGEGGAAALMQQMVDQVRTVGLLNSHPHLIIANDFASKRLAKQWRNIDGKIMVWATMENMLGNGRSGSSGSGEPCSFGIGYTSLYSVYAGQLNNVRHSSVKFGKHELIAPPARPTPPDSRKYVLGI
jgi:hypothetical protein